MKIPIELRWAFTDTRYWVGFRLRQFANRFSQPPLSLSGAPYDFLIRYVALACDAEGRSQILEHPAARVVVTAIQYSDERRYSEAIVAAEAALASAAPYRAVGQTTENPT